MGRSRGPGGGRIRGESGGRKVNGCCCGGEEPSPYPCSNCFGVILPATVTATFTNPFQTAGTPVRCSQCDTIPDGTFVLDAVSACGWDYENALEACSGYDGIGFPNGTTIEQSIGVSITATQVFLGTSLCVGGFCSYVEWTASKLAGCRGDYTLTHSYSLVSGSAPCYTKTTIGNAFVTI